MPSRVLLAAVIVGAAATAWADWADGGLECVDGPTPECSRDVTPPALARLGWSLRSVENGPFDRGHLVLYRRRGQALEVAEVIVGQGAERFEVDGARVASQGGRRVLELDWSWFSSATAWDCPPRELDLAERHRERCRFDGPAGEACEPVTGPSVFARNSCPEATDAGGLPCVRAPLAPGSGWVSELIEAEGETTRRWRAREEVVRTGDGGLAAVRIVPLEIVETDGSQVPMAARVVSALPDGGLALEPSMRFGAWAPLTPRWVEPLLHAQLDARATLADRVRFLAWRGSSEPVQLVERGARAHALGPAHAYSVRLALHDASASMGGVVDDTAVDYSGELLVLDGTTLIVEAHLRGRETTVHSGPDWPRCRSQDACVDGTERPPRRSGSPLVTPLRLDLTSGCGALQSK